MPILTLFPGEMWRAIIACMCTIINIQMCMCQGGTWQDHQVKGQLLWEEKYTYTNIRRARMPILDSSACSPTSPSPSQPLLSTPTSCVRYRKGIRDAERSLLRALQQTLTQALLSVHLMFNPSWFYSGKRSAKSACVLCPDQGGSPTRQSESSISGEEFPPLPRILIHWMHAISYDMAPLVDNNEYSLPANGCYDTGGMQPRVVSLKSSL